MSTLRKNINQKLWYLSGNGFKNAIIVFGFCISILTITSYDSISNSSQSGIVSSHRTAEVQKPESHDALKIEKKTLKKEQKSNNYHNFIASYLLRESSFKRKNKKSSEENSFLRSLRDLHKTIFVNALGSF